MMNVQSVTTVQRLAYTLCEAELASGLSRATLYRLHARGELKMIKAGGRRLVPSAELERLCTADPGESAA